MYSKLLKSWKLGSITSPPLSRVWFTFLPQKRRPWVRGRSAGSFMFFAWEIGIFWSCRVPDVGLWDYHFSSYFVIDELLANQIALSLPVWGRAELGKLFGIDCSRFLFSPTPLPSRSPVLLLNFLLTPGAPLLSRLLRHSLRTEKKKKRLLRRLLFARNRSFEGSYKLFRWFIFKAYYHIRFSSISS